MCFCDLPLSNIVNHIDTYGSYGIGLTKDWGRRNAINPIIYLERDSTLSRSMNEIVREAYGRSELRRVFEIISYIKPYSGRFEKTGGNVTFYDEREWRHVPSIQLRENPLSFDNKVQEKITAGQFHLPQYRLSFTPDDIKYLVVQNDQEIIELSAKIDRIKGERYTHNALIRLKSRIITIKMIKEDI